MHSHHSLCETVNITHN